MHFDTTHRLDAGSEAFRLWTLWLGHRLAEHGAGPHEHHLAQFAAMAVAHGVEPEMTAVLADPERNDVERARAFFVVATAFEQLVIA